MTKKKMILFGGLLAAAVVVAVVLKRRSAAATGGETSNFAGTGTNTTNWPRLQEYKKPNNGTLGDKSNNPLNIRFSTANNWAGQVGYYDAGSNGKFAVFKTRGYGIRAAIKLIKNYIKGGSNTIAKIINRWAPASDGNNPTGYAAKVATQTGINKDTVIAANEIDKIGKIVKAMAVVETGLHLTNAEIDEGKRLLNLQNV